LNIGGEAFSSNFWGRVLLFIFSLRGWIKGKNNEICYEGKWPRGIKIKIKGDDNRIKIGKGTGLKNVFFNIKTSGVNLSIGDHCNFVRTYVSMEADVSIGGSTTISGIVIMAQEGARITIGQDCTFSTEVEIRSGDGHGIYQLEGEGRINEAKEVVIGDHCWIGKRAVILKGSKIGNGSVVGFSSVLTSEIPENSVAAGIPAKTIRQGIAWTRRIREESRPETVTVHAQEDKEPCKG